MNICSHIIKVHNIFKFLRHINSSTFFKKIIYTYLMLLNVRLHSLSFKIILLLLFIIVALLLCCSHYLFFNQHFLKLRHCSYLNRDVNET